MNRYQKEKIFLVLMYASAGIIAGALLLVIGLNIIKGGIVLVREPSLLWTAPSSTYLLGGEGGILHAITGSVCMVIPSTIIAAVIGYLIAAFLQIEYVRQRFADRLRVMLDILWGIPSILYGVFMLNILILCNWRSSLMMAIVTLTLLQIPILTRYMDEALRAVPGGLREAMYSLGATKTESSKMTARYALPGMTSGVLMGMGRAMGDAAAVTFTAGAGNAMPTGLFSSATALPILIYLQANSFYPSVREHAYAASCILVVLVLGLSLLSRAIGKKYSKYTSGGRG